MNVSRRNFLKQGIGTAGLCLGWNHLSTIASYAAAFEPRKAGSSKILVVVQLAGGNDGINTVIPYSQAAYYKLRPTLGIKEDKLLVLNKDVGLNPNMTAMADLYKAGKVAIVLGAGYPNPNRSHSSIEIWQTAEPERIADTGWLGRYLDNSSDCKTVGGKLFPAINVDSFLPKTLSAEHIIVPSVSNMNQFKFNTDSHYQKDRKCQMDSFNRIYSQFDIDRPQVRMLRSRFGCHASFRLFVASREELQE